MSIAQGANTANGQTRLEPAIRSQNGKIILFRPLRLAGAGRQFFSRSGESSPVVLIKSTLRPSISQRESSEWDGTSNRWQ